MLWGANMLMLRGLKDEWRVVHKSEPERHMAFAQNIARSRVADAYVGRPTAYCCCC